MSQFEPNDIRRRENSANAWAGFAALPNSLTAVHEYSALQTDPPPRETLTRSENTSFTRIGWKYVVTVAATWGDGASVVLQDASSAARLTFTEDGTQTIELLYGTYSFAITIATNVAAKVSTGVYSDGSGETP